MKLLEQNINAIIALCKLHKVNTMFVFGSILTSKFNDESDVDFLVDFKKDEISDYFSNFFDLKNALEDVLHREVDLVEEKYIQNPYFKKNVDNSKRMIYG